VKVGIMAVIVENAASRIPISHESGTSGSVITPSPLEQQEISTVGSVPTQERNSNTNESSSSSPSESQPPALPSSEARLGQIDMLLASFGVGLMAVGLTFGLSKYSFDAFLIGSCKYLDFSERILNKNSYLLCHY
jgi:hypothetical protein